jgi:hypothetical protein
MIVQYLRIAAIKKYWELFMEQSLNEPWLFITAHFKGTVQ